MNELVIGLGDTKINSNII